MIVRIVKMTFQEAKTEQFLKIFHQSKDQIRSVKGCLHLELMNDINNPAVFMTYSLWQNEAAIDDYRNSELFKTTWASVKTLFAQPAEAYSLNSLVKLV